MNGPDSRWLWAKTSADRGWHPLAAHLIDVALVAERLWSDWLTAGTRRWLAEPLDDEAVAGPLFALLAGCHDLGKSSPAFQVQVDWLIDQIQAAGLPLPRQLPSRGKAPHALVSAATIRPILAERGWTEDAIEGAAAILGGHHGWFPPEGYALEPLRRPQLYGWSQAVDDPWMSARQQLFDLVVEVTGAEDALRCAATIGLGSARELTLAGFVILADWIASNAAIFPYVSQPYDESYLELARHRALRALEHIGWHRVRVGGERAEHWFTDRFGFAPNPLQAKTIELAEGCEPGLFLVEAPMGIGKTEAAFAVAEVLATRVGLGGLFLGLPTQATANQMFRRTKGWLEHLGPGTYVLELAHGRARQVDEYRALVDQGAPSCVDLDEATQAVITAESWFAGPKRRLLAPFVVGTIDQALMCVAKVRHVALRQVGLAGKVVIFDEVHAYEAYMSVFLRRALRWLGEEQIPVVLLSATLPPAARARLVEAYVGHSVDLGAVAYPSVITVSPGGKARTTPVTTSRVAVEVIVEHLEEAPDDTTFSATSDRMAAIAEAGANVLVIRNTVARAQATYRALAERLPRESTHLVHARFRAGDRLAKEAYLAASFGPGAGRPSGQVVVGTQVLEQSLDVDFDVLVTDLAPIDLVLQRVGRVHRHGGVVRPAGFDQPKLILAGWQHGAAAGPRFPSGSVRVYGEHLLLRSAAVLLERKTLALPDDVAVLVATVYGDEHLVPSSWSERARSVAEGWRAGELARERHAEGYAIAGPEAAGHLLELCRLGLGDPGDDDDPAVQAAVRDSAVSVEVVIGFPGTSPDTVRCGSAEVPLEHVPSPGETDAILSSVLRLPSHLTTAALELDVPAGWQAHPWLRGQRLLVVNHAGDAVMGHHVVCYREDTGLEVGDVHGG